jgi:hypothetical protein
MKIMLAIALKEWAAICFALTTGKQILLLRKGGIDEATGEFRVEHPRFWLYPTHVHQQEQGLIAAAAAWAAPDPLAVGERKLVSLPAWAEVVDSWRIESEAAALRLSPFHFWTEQTIRKRFVYRQPGLQALIVRVHTLATPHVVAETAQYQGCRSWVELDKALPTEDAAAVLADDEFTAQANAIRELLR